MVAFFVSNFIAETQWGMSAALVVAVASILLTALNARVGVRRNELEDLRKENLTLRNRVDHLEQEVDQLTRTIIRLTRENDKLRGDV